MPEKGARIKSVILAPFANPGILRKVDPTPHDPFLREFHRRWIPEGVSGPGVSADNPAMAGSATGADFGFSGITNPSRSEFDKPGIRDAVKPERPAG